MSIENKLKLSETLKRYNLLSEYEFYIPRKDDNMYLGNEDTIEEQDVETTEVATTPETTTPDATTTDVSATATPDVPATETPVPDATTTAAAPAGGEVEVDVTDIVKDTKETKDAVNSGNQKVDELLNKLSDLENKLSAMNGLMDKIEQLENEFERRNPTPEEKLEMRSLDSFPYNLKLTDYWSEKEGAYDVLRNSKNGRMVNNQPPVEDKEYVLTQGEVEKDYNEGEISDSFYPED
jgi:hypothetical protein